VAIGSWGDVIFEVSSDKVLTFDDLERDIEDRWEKHDIIGEAPKSEYLGQGLDTVTLTLIFDVSFGVNPRHEVDRLREMSRSGQAEDLIIGGKGLGIKLWKIKSMKQKFQRLDNEGRLLHSEVSVTFEEYV
jgi:phage protein U